MFSPVAALTGTTATPCATASRAATIAATPSGARSILLSTRTGSAPLSQTALR